MRDVMLVALVGLVAIVGLMSSGASGLATYGDGYFGPEYTSSGYYGRRLMEIRGAGSPEGFAAADICGLQEAMEDRHACCKGSCDYDGLCEATCARMVSQRSYQKLPHPRTIID